MGQAQGQQLQGAMGVTPATSSAAPAPTGPVARSEAPKPEVPASRERSRSRDGRDVGANASSSVAPQEPAKATSPPREKTPPKCHLHNTKKPNAKCKFCQKWLESQKQAEAEAGGDKGK